MRNLCENLPKHCCLRFKVNHLAHPRQTGLNKATLSTLSNHRFVSEMSRIKNWQNVFKMSRYFRGYGCRRSVQKYFFRSPFTNKDTYKKSTHCFMWITWPWTGGEVWSLDNISPKMKLAHSSMEFSHSSESFRCSMAFGFNSLTTDKITALEKATHLRRIFRGVQCFLWTQGSSVQYFFGSHTYYWWCKILFLGWIIRSCL